MQLLTGSDGEHAVLHDLGGDGPPLLLTHGNGLNAGMWATVVPHLRSAVHCYGLDFRGHGASRPRSEGFSVDRGHLVDEVMAAAEHLGTPLDAVGHSLGGATLIRAELEHPGTFRRLWVFEPVIVPPGRARPDDAHPLVVASRKRRSRFASADDAIARFRSKPPFSECEPEAVRAYVELGTREVTAPDGGSEVELTCIGDTEARIFLSGTHTDFDTLRAVSCPTVVARGESIAPGNDIPPAVAAPIAEALGRGQLLPMEGLTHFGPMEDGAAVAEAIRRHLLAGES
jgi:pimeloyl-ACP methyl ester carboxylesterase